MEKYIVSVEGIDNSGKSTLIIEIRKYLERFSQTEVKTTMKMNLHKLSKIYPKDRSKIADFYMNAPIETVVEALLEINKNKTKFITKSGSEYSILDRGYITTIAGCIAQVRTRNDWSFERAFNFVKKINRKVQYVPIENEAIVLYLDKKKAISIFKKREGKKFKNIHLKYIKYFAESFNKLIKSKDIEKFKIKQHFINADIPKKEIYNKTLKIYENVTNLKYHLFVEEFLKKVNKKDFKAIVIGGSYIREDIIPNWSDVDGEFILKNNISKAKVRKFTDKLSKKYGIRFNPRLIHEKELKVPEELQLKILVFLMPNYDSKALFGKKPSMKISQKLVSNKIKEEAYPEILIFLDNLFKNKDARDEDKVKRGIRNCFILVKLVLLKKGILVSSYEETIQKGLKKNIKEAVVLKKFLEIRNNWNEERPNYRQTVINIKKFVKSMERYFK